jgi:hypothetical protein
MARVFMRASSIPEKHRVYYRNRKRRPPTGSGELIRPLRV